jgi:hypothetical protein
MFLSRFTCVLHLVLPNSQQILDSRAEYWYRKLAGFSGVWNAAKAEALQGLKKVCTWLRVAFFHFRLDRLSWSDYFCRLSHVCMFLFRSRFDNCFTLSYVVPPPYFAHLIIYCDVRGFLKQASNPGELTVHEVTSAGLIFLQVNNPKLECCG